MKKTVAIGSILLMLAATGCAESRSDIAPDDRTLNDKELCLKYHELRNYNIDAPNIRKILTENGKIKKEEWDLINNGTIKKGMTELAVTCALGAPYFGEYSSSTTKLSYSKMNQTISPTFRDGVVSYID